jgi:GAF domain-containing protein
VAELGVVTRALLAIARDGVDDRALAMRICRACVAGLDVDGAAISLLTGSVARQTLAVTDDTAQLLEDLQFTLNEGACMEAASTGRPVLVADLQKGSEVARWPVFAAGVLEQSAVRAVFALPLQWGAVNLGVLDLYRCQPGALEDDQLRDAMASADTAALMMLGLRTEPDQGGAGWLDHAVASRAEIHQATGMVSVQLDVSTPEALARMRAVVTCG